MLDILESLSFRGIRSRLCRSKVPTDTFGHFIVTSRHVYCFLSILHYEHIWSSQLNWNQQSTSQFWNIYFCSSNLILLSNLIPSNLSTAEHPIKILLFKITFCYLHDVLLHKNAARLSRRRYSFYLKGIKAIQDEEKRVHLLIILFLLSVGGGYWEGNRLSCHAVACWDAGTHVGIHPLLPCHNAAKNSRLSVPF